MGEKSLDSLPPRVLRFRLRLMRFQYTIHHSPRKSLYLADTLSRAPLRASPEEVNSLSQVEKEVEIFVDAVVAAVPAHGDRLDKYRQAQASDPECAKLIEFCQSGWPAKHFRRAERILASSRRSHRCTRSTLIWHQNRNSEQFEAGNPGEDTSGRPRHCPLSKKGRKFNLVARDIQRG